MIRLRSSLIAGVLNLHWMEMGIFVIPSRGIILGHIIFNGLMKAMFVIVKVFRVS